MRVVCVLVCTVVHKVARVAKRQRVTENENERARARRGWDGEEAQGDLQGSGSSLNPG